MSKALILRKTTLNLRVETLGVLYHAVDQMLVNVGDIAQFSYSYSPKILQTQEYIVPSSNFHLEMSRKPNLN